MHAALGHGPRPYGLAGFQIGLDDHSKDVAGTLVKLDQRWGSQGRHAGLNKAGHDQFIIGRVSGAVDGPPLP